MYQKTEKPQVYNNLIEQTYVTNGPSESNEIQIPEFKRLFDCLANAVDHTNDLSNELYRYGNTIKSISEPTTESNGISKVPTGIIEMLFEEVFKLQRSNDQLVMLANHLRNTVGI